MAYEVKVSVSDFRADVTSGKWQEYLRYAHGVLFACEGKLISKSQVPEICGLIVRTDKIWRTVKRPTLSPVKLPTEALLKLLIDGVDREGPAIRSRKYMANGYSEKFARKYGQKAALWVAKAVTIDREIENAEYSAKRIVEVASAHAEKIKSDIGNQIDARWIELCKVLGVEDPANTWRIRSEIEKLRQSREGSPEQRLLKQIRSNLSRIVEQFDGLIEDQPVCKTEQKCPTHLTLY